VGVFPVVHEFTHKFDSMGWLAAWCLLYILQETFSRYITGSAADRLSQQLGRISNAFGGTIARVHGFVLDNRKHQLDETQTGTVLEKLLQRVRETAEVAFDIPDQVQVRATLAIPFTAVGDTQPSALHVSYYDDTHADRRYSKLTMEHPGAPQAYQTSAVQIIDDIRKNPGFEDRSYRSVLSLPVYPSKGGKPIAVVNVDCDVPGLFRKATISRSLPLFSPILHMIAYTLEVRARGGVNAVSK
jgi:hypothetical protein